MPDYYDSIYRQVIKNLQMEEASQVSYDKLASKMKQTCNENTKIKDLVSSKIEKIRTAESWERKRKREEFYNELASKKMKNNNEFQRELDSKGRCLKEAQQRKEILDKCERASKKIDEGNSEAREELFQALQEYNDLRDKQSRNY